MAAQLLYDADCGFCTRSAELLRSWGCGAEVVALQRVDLAALGVSEADALARIQYVDEAGRREGHAAIEAALSTGHRRPVRLLGRLLRLVPDRMAERAYDYVAAHRYALPGGTAACKMAESS